MTGVVFSESNLAQTMYRNYKIIALIPSLGQKRYLEILLPYLKRAKVFDEIRLWLHNGRIADPAYIESLKYDQDVPIVPVAKNFEPSWTQPFYYDCLDQAAIYYRIDQDVVYVEEHAVQRLLDYRIDHPEPFIVSANVVNNGLCTCLHQQYRAIDTRYGVCTFRSNDWIAYKNVGFLKYLHETFLDAAEAGDVSKFFFPTITLENYEYFSINNFAFFGKDFAEFGGEMLPGLDEGFLCQVKPKELSRPCAICGDALVVHHAFYPQRAGIDQYPEILERYKRLSEKLL